MIQKGLQVAVPQAWKAIQFLQLFIDKPLVQGAVRLPSTPRLRVLFISSLRRCLWDLRRVYWPGERTSHPSIVNLGSLLRPCDRRVKDRQPKAVRSVSVRTLAKVWNVCILCISI